ncbi:unnamed protein product [Pelagomonas calceolata]|uniref:Uncharacterized protein n=1 Tax=Pelagomonas calceolata TaxID=35677 RepID=A0A8J2ST95_9STRA|nr:unnamed protein product [Pelagomonas calceolata]
MSTRLFLYWLPFAAMYRSWYKWWSIFFASRYFRNNLRRTRCRRIQSTLTGMRALAEPLRLPRPVCRPLRFASRWRVTRLLEWTTTGLRITKPSLISFLMFWREFAMEISFASFGSSQTRFLPVLRTDAARRFCNLSDDMALSASTAAALSCAGSCGAAVVLRWLCGASGGLQAVLRRP